jgi:uncharacterized protein
LFRISIAREVVISKLIQKEPRTYALIFETGDEIASTLKQFARENGLAGSSFKAIGFRM